VATLSIDDLVQAVATYVNKSATDNGYVEACTRQAVTFIGEKFDSSLRGEEDETLADFIAAALERMSPATYTREVEELGADLFYRRQAENGILGVNAMDGTIARISADPWASSERRLARWLGLGFA